MRSDRVLRRKTIRKNTKLTNRSKRTRVKRSKKSKKSKKSKLSRKNRRSFIKKSRTNKRFFGRNRRMRGGADTISDTVRRFLPSESAEEIAETRAVNAAHHAYVQRVLNAASPKRIADYMGIKNPTDQDLKNVETGNVEDLMVEKLSNMGIAADLEHKNDIIQGLTEPQLERFISEMNMGKDFETGVRAFWGRARDAAAAAAAATAGKIIQPRPFETSY